MCSTPCRRPVRPSRSRSRRPAAARSMRPIRTSPSRRWRNKSNDDYQFAQMQNVPTVPIETGTDGGMNRVFMSQARKPDLRLRQRRPHARAAVAAGPAAAADFDQGIIRRGQQSSSRVAARSQASSAACSTRTARRPASPRPTRIPQGLRAPLPRAPRARRRIPASSATCSRRATRSRRMRPPDTEQTATATPPGKT